jgi:hypothetical protein
MGLTVMNCGQIIRVCSYYSYRSRTDSKLISGADIHAYLTAQVPKLLHYLILH